MNRQIKFRVWDFREKKFINEGYSDFLALDLDGTLIRVQTDSCETPSREVTGNFEIMQFTGLTDKNGKEIYEGDILKINHKDYTYQVVYEKYKFVAYHTRSTWGVWGDICKFEEQGFEIEVIGNIHENTELLS